MTLMSSDCLQNKAGGAAHVTQSCTAHRQVFFVGGKCKQQKEQKCLSDIAKRIAKSDSVGACGNTCSFVPRGCYALHLNASLHIQFVAVVAVVAFVSSRQRQLP